MSMELSTSMFFLGRSTEWSEEKPYELRFKPPNGFPWHNISKQEHSGVVIHDIRGREHEFSLEKTGFSLLDITEPFPREKMNDVEYIKSKFFPSVAQIVKQHMNAERVQIYDYVVGDPK